MALAITQKQNRIPFVTLGSEDSRDIDNLYIFSSMPNLQQCKDFCDKKTDNRNIAVIERGVVRECYKGTPDELNNSLYHTYSLHAQEYENPVNRQIRRIVPLKVFRSLRVILSHLTDTPLRGIVKAALNSGDFEKRKKVLEEIDFTTLDLSKDYLKTIAFQLAQTNALISGQELYTKSELKKRFPELEELLSRGNNPNLDALNLQRDLLINPLSKVYTRRCISLNLFCFKNGPEVGFRSSKNWNAFVSQSRGIIIDSATERCVHYPFDKFFRVNEIPENNEELLPRDENVEIVEKVDGSMVSVLKNNQKVILAFKGSFDADSCPEIRKISQKYPLSSLDFDRYSFVFEAVSPHTRYPRGYTVIDYGDREELILIGVRDKLTNELLKYDEVKQIARTHGFSSPSRFLGNLDDVLAETSVDQKLKREGYVARFETGKMVKIKYKKYMEAVRAVNDLKTDLFVRKLLGKNEDNAAEIIDSLPDNVREAGLQSHEKYSRILDTIKKYFEDFKLKHGSDTETYALDHLPSIIRKPLLRFYRGQGYERNLESLARRYFSKGEDFTVNLETNTNYVERYVRKKPENRNETFEGLSEEVKEKAASEIEKFKRLYGSMEIYIKSAVLNNPEFSGSVLKSVPGILRKPLLRHARGLSYRKRLEKAALSYYNKGLSFEQQGI